jgi:hypothetical protein
VERLVEEVVGARLEAAHLALGVGQGGEQDDRHEAGGPAPLEATADLEAVEARHHDVEQDGVRQSAPRPPGLEPSAEETCPPPLGEAL